MKFIPSKLTRPIPTKKVALFIFVVNLILLGFILGGQKDLIKQWTQGQFALLRISAGDTVSVKELARMMNNKTFTLINVHTPYEGEIAKTDTFIPYDKIIENSSSLPEDKNTPIILYCKTGRMSAEALDTVRKLGYTNVRHLSGGTDAWQGAKQPLLDLSILEGTMFPKDGIEFPVVWGEIGPKLISLGVIDVAKFKEAVPLTPQQEKILLEGSTENIKITRENSQFIVDMLWALGLAQKSIVYDEGPLGKEYKTDAGNFASTGGWTLARGEATAYLNKFDLVPLTAEQQKQVGEIAKNVYRPCCGNSTWFPDCNHGMAALAAIELMVSAGIDEATIYKSLLALNSHWFVDSYLTVATYFARQGTPWDKIDAKAVLGETYSSGRGAGETAKKVGPLPYKPAPTGGGCRA